VYTLDGRNCKKRVIEDNAKCYHFKKIDLCRDFAAGIYLSEAQNPIYSPPLSHGIRVVYLFTQGRGEGRRVELERMLEGQQFLKLARK
jgi:hypothetical protein